jgi:hypothetical protein
MQNSSSSGGQNGSDGMGNEEHTKGSGDALIREPLILIGAPRSGTTMLFQALSAHPDLWSLYRESQPILDAHFPVAMEPGRSAFVPSQSVSDETAQALEREFFDAVGNVEGAQQALARFLPLIVRNRLSESLRRMGRQRKRPPIRIVEKTPDNCFRIQMLLRVFPDARFVFVVRDPRGSIASVLHGWRDESRFRRYPMPEGYSLEGYQGADWCFGLIPGWEDLNGSRLIDVCARQWVSYNEYCLRDLPRADDRVFRVRYEELSSNPGPVLEDLARWAALNPEPLRRFKEKLPVVNTWSRPSEDKWRWAAEELSTVTGAILPMARQLGYDLEPSSTAST